MMPLLPALEWKMSAKRGGDDDEEAEVGERPGGVLARGAAAEVLFGDEDLRAGL